MNLGLNFNEYTNAIATLLCDSFDFTTSKANDELSDFNDFLKVCFADEWSVLSCAEMIAAEA